MKQVFLMLMVLVGMGTLSSCLKERYDAPPTGGKDPLIAVTSSIKDLKARYLGLGPVEITDDVVISGVVVADDKSGNFYKTLALQDSTGGIALYLGGSSLYTDYPIGRRLFIKCKGLWLSDYGGLIQMGGYIDETGTLQELPSNLFDRHILKGVWGIEVAPLALSINQLNSSHQNMLIELNNVEFTTSDAGKTYADAVNKISQNRTLKNCGSSTVVIRTSGYAAFASKTTPSGNGRLVAIYSEYNGDPQLLIRDLSDIHLDSARCGGGTVTGNGIRAIAAAYQGSDVTLPSGKTITGVVISDKSNGNMNANNIAIQDTTGGIVVRFTSVHNWALNDVLTIDVSGQQLTSYNGLIEINNVPLSNATKTGTGSITPKVVTVAQVQANSGEYQSTLLTVQNATASGGSTYGGSGRVINDSSGSLSLYTASSASFANTTLPSGTHSFTGVLGYFNVPQLQLRSTSDVQ